MDEMNIKKQLRVLKLEGRTVEELSIREIILAYKRLAKSVHPDTSGYDSKEDFQELANAYEKILEVVVNKTKSEDTNTSPEGGAP